MPNLIIRANSAEGIFSENGGGTGGTIVWEDTFATGIREEWTANTSGTSNATHHSEEGGFVRITYNSNGDRGLNIRLADRNQRQVYLRMYSRQNVHTNDGPKHVKIFGQGVLQGGEGSNITFQMLGYGSEYGITYGDRNSGSNDNSVEMGFDGILGGGGVYSRDPPTFVVTSDPIYADLNWHRWDYYWKLNDPGQKNGELEIRYDGETVLHMIEMYNCADSHGPIDVIGIGQYLNFYDGTPFSRDYRLFAIAHDGWID